MNVGPSDEELLLAIRLGKKDNETKLIDRYVGKMFSYAKKACPGVVGKMDNIEFKATYFSSLFQAFKTYTFGRGSLRNYFLKILSHELPRSLSKILSQPTYYLLRAEDEDGEFLHDVLQDQDPRSDPRYFLNILEVLESFNHIPKGLDRKAMAVFRSKMAGLTMGEIAKKYKLTYNQVRRKIFKVQNFYKEFLNASQKF